MCHLILFLPVVALPVFWLMPLNMALPVYLIVVASAGLLYWLIARSMGRQPETGSESMVGATAEVVSRLSPGNNAQFLVRHGGELWTAVSADAVKPGEMVSVAAVDGIRLVVQKNGGQGQVIT